MPETPPGPSTVRTLIRPVEATQPPPVPEHQLRAEVKAHKLRILRRMQVAVVADDDTTVATLLSILGDLYVDAIAAQTETSEVDAHWQSNAAAGVTVP